MQNVFFWFRNTSPGSYSIENIFNGVSCGIDKYFGNQIQINKKHVPYPSNSLNNIGANIIYALSQRRTIHHVTGDIHYIIPYLKGIKILTIHDLILLKRPTSEVKKCIYKSLWYKHPIKSADIITVVSPQIKKELLDLMQIDDNKIRVIPNFYHPFFNTLFVEKKTVPDKKSVLFIGVTENKNLANSIRALTGTGITLNIVGRPTSNIIQLLCSCKVSYNIYENLSLGELGKLYQISSCLLYPSLYEGFGIPIIEAQAAGLPVITSNIEPMKWVASDGAILINPHDILSIREAILNVIENNEKLNPMIKKGFENIKRFDFKQIVEQYFTCYEDYL
jgi:glycosyltransferase involved in cell wall biosynthesis